MLLFYTEPCGDVYCGDSRKLPLADESVQCLVASPPYWGLRRYSGNQEMVWGDDVTCALGLEKTPEEYVSHIVQIFGEVKRVLRKDGVAFLNIGDSYAGGKGTCFNPGGGKGSFSTHSNRKDAGVYPLDRGNISTLRASRLKPKDLCLIPFRLAIALQEPYQEFSVKKLEDRAWLAGIVDADGTIGIHHLHRGSYHQFEPFIAVGSSDLPMVERCVAITGMGGSRQRTEPNFIDNRGIVSRRTHYEWRLEGKNAAKVLEDIWPYLIVKERQARIAYALWANLQNTKELHKGKGHRLPDNILQERLGLWQLCKDCNQRKEAEVNLPSIPQHIEDGWWIRSVIIWSKNNPMPESVSDRPTESHEYLLMLTKSAGPQYWTHRDLPGTRVRPKADYRWVNELTGGEVDTEPPDWKEKITCPECDGTGNVDRQIGWYSKEEQCSKCAGKGKTRLWERINLWKGHDYYWDAEAVREHGITGDVRRPYTSKGAWDIDGRPESQQHGGELRENFVPGRNIRTVWEFPTRPYPQAHFAVFPERLPELCIKAATPEVGCCSKCGAPWVRVVETHYDKNRPSAGEDKRSRNEDRLSQARGHGGWRGNNLLRRDTTLGWRPSCSCNAEKVPSVVMDNFCGAGTTLKVAKGLGRRYIGVDISEEYCELARKRVESVTLPM